MSNKISFLKSIAVRLVLFFTILAFILGGFFIIWLISLPIPDFSSFEERVSAESTKIYDRTGEILLYDVHENVKRTIVPLEEISDYVKYATIAIEDQSFYDHAGVKPTAILRAFLVNISTGRVEQGGSTLTQQVVKNTLLTQDKKFSRKFKELILSLKVEQTVSKDRILELYLNETPYGGNLYGIEEAAKSYFGRQAKDLSIAQSAYLASLPQAPTFLSPYGNNKDRLTSRKNLTLKNMRDLGFISNEEYQEALAEEVVFLRSDSASIRAPHFVFFVLDYLYEKYGEETVRNGGLKVITTLDWEAQQKAEEIVSRFGEQNKINFNASNAGMIAMDPRTGQILVMVGSVDYFDIENNGNFNITTASRQPGSAFKPFVYAAALEKGYTPETVVFDLKTEFNTNCSPNSIPQTPGANCYSPVNYDNVFVGPITFRNALAQSRNVPAVKALYLVGINNAVRLASNAGITTLNNPERYGLTLVLGGGEVKLLELVNAYGVFANEGDRYIHTGILEIINREDRTIEKFSPRSTRVLSQNTARQISDILSDNTARTPAFGPNSLLNIPGVAVKTGTTNNYRDAWIIGYTPDVVIGAWAGNNDNSSMERRVAGMIIAPMWQAFTSQYLQNKPRNFFTAPEPTPSDLKPVLRGKWEGSQSYFIDSTTGNIATESTPLNLREEVIIRQVHSILHWVDRSNPRGPIPNNPNSDGQYILWETPVRNWALNQGIINQATEINNIEPLIETETTEISP